MPLDGHALGRTLGPLRLGVDARWLMAYAAAAAVEEPAAFDTTRQLTVHPLFPVAPEWALVVADLAGVTPERGPAERARGVHLWHDVTWGARLVPDQVIRVDGSVSGVTAHRAGALLVLSFRAKEDGLGRSLWTSRTATLFRGVAVVAPGGDGAPPSVGVAVDGGQQSGLAIGRNEAHTYSECARIWNPIHTDLAVARAAGLIAPPLHGTATLARAVTAALALAGRGLDEVVRVTGRFSGLVLPGSLLTLNVAATADGFAMTASDVAGAVVLRDARVELGHR